VQIQECKITPCGEQAQGVGGPKTGGGRREFHYIHIFIGCHAIIDSIRFILNIAVVCIWGDWGSERRGWADLSERRKLGMNKYHIVKQLGDGSFGSVLQAEIMETREKVGGNMEEMIDSLGPSLSVSPARLLSPKTLHLRSPSKR